MYLEFYLSDTYMICHMGNVSLDLVGGRGEEDALVWTVDSDVPAICLGEGSDLQIVGISAVFGHVCQIVGPSFLNVGLGGRCQVNFCALSLGRSACCTGRLGTDEGEVVGGVVAHVLDYCCADFYMLALVAVHLVRQGMEQTVSCIEHNISLRSIEYAVANRGVVEDTHHRLQYEWS